jgi:hypothetical protein
MCAASLCVGYGVYSRKMDHQELMEQLVGDVYVSRGLHQDACRRVWQASKRLGPQPQPVRAVALFLSVACQQQSYFNCLLNSTSLGLVNELLDILEC